MTITELKKISLSIMISYIKDSNIFVSSPPSYPPMVESEVFAFLSLAD